METLSPIPVPPAQRWREFRIRLLPILTFSIALAAVVVIWRHHASAPAYLGEAEVTRADIISTVPGLLVEMNVQRFDKVRKGQVIGKVYPTDPELLKAALTAALTDVKMFQTQIALNERRNDVNYEQARMDWVSQRIALATAKVNLEFAENEFQRQSALFDEKIVSQSEFDLAKRARDARRQEVEEVSREVAEGEKHLADLAKTQPDSIDSTNLLNQAIAAEEAKLLLADGPITLIAPIDGVVSVLHHRSGERVNAGVPIMTITSPDSDRIIAFARQPLQRVPQVGDKIEVRTRSLPRKRGIGTVLDVGAGMDVMVPPATGRLDPFSTALANPIERGLAFSVAMPAGLQIHPGETVDLLLPR